MSGQYPNLFKGYPTRQGRDWLKSVHAEDRKAFSWIGCAAHDFGKLGGRARAKTARRDARGRFMKTEQNNG